MWKPVLKELSIDPNSPQLAELGELAQNIWLVLEDEPLPAGTQRISIEHRENRFTAPGRLLRPTEDATDAITDATEADLLAGVSHGAALKDRDVLEAMRCSDEQLTELDMIDEQFLKRRFEARYPSRDGVTSKPITRKRRLNCEN